MVTAAPGLEALVTDSAFWYDARQTMVPIAKRVFREAFLLGAALGAREQPEGVTARRRAPEVVIGEMLRVGARAVGDIPTGGDFTPLPFDFEAIATAAEEAIDSYTDDWWRTVEASTQRQMRDTIKRGVRDGLTTRQIIAEFDPLFGPERAANIAVSETTTLMGRGAQATYQRAGLRQWIWRTAADPVVDIDCEQLARASDPKKGGTPFPMTRSFQKAHPRCRCWPVPFGEATATGQPVVEIPEPAIDLPTQYPYGLPEGADFAKPDSGWFDTEALHTTTDPVTGRKRWTAEREKLHDEIVRRHLTATAQAEPTAYMMGGGPASGKSTVIKQGHVKLPDDIVTIDPDAIKAMLPEYQGMLKAGDPRGASFAHEESSYLSKRILSESSGLKNNIMLDGTGDNTIDKLAQKIQDLRFGGQRVIGEYMTLDTDLAVQIADLRAIKTGRKVDHGIIRDTHRSVSKVLPDAIDRGLFDEVRLWDNNIEGNPRLVLHAIKREGRQEVTIHSRELWRDFLKKAELEPGLYGFEAGAKYVEGLKDTMDLHTFNGRWTRSREALHDEIVDEILGAATPVANPTAYMMGGGPASGKSTLVKQGHVKLPDNLVQIDPDAIKGMLPEYKRMVEAGDEFAAGFAHEESSYLSKRILKEASETKRNLLLDGTGDNSIEKLQQKIADMRLGGHRVVGEYVSLDTDLAIQNADIRAIKTGRKVDHGVIRDTHASVSKVFGDAVDRGLFDEVRLWDTNINGQPRLVLHASKNAEGLQTVTLADRGLWRDFLAKAELQPGAYSFDAVTARRTAQETREAMLARPDVQELVEAQARAEAIARRAQSFATDDPYPSFTPLDFSKIDLTDPGDLAFYEGINAQRQAAYREWNARRKVVMDARDKALADAKALQRKVSEAILEDGIYAAEPANFTVDAPWIDRLRKPEQKGELQRGLTAFRRLLGNESPIEGLKVAIVGRPRVRAFYANKFDKVTVSYSEKAETIVHELGHWLEDHSTEVQTVRRIHVEARTAGQSPERLKDITTLNYKADERTLKDEFFDPYVGKVYPGKATSETISMSLQELYDNPLNLARRDPRLFDFIYDLLMDWRP